MRIYKLLFFIGLLGGVIMSCGSPLGDSFSRQFVISDTLTIRSIFISGESDFLLKRIENGWELNNESRVNQIAINNLLLAFSRLEKLGVTKNHNWGESKPILFTLETKKEKYSFSFIFSEDGAYISKTGLDEFYRFGIKGFPEAKVEELFSGSEHHWKDPLIINFRPELIKEIEVIPAESWGEPFKINRKGEEWVLLDMEGNEVSKENTDREKLFDYCRNFFGIYFDKELEDKDLYKNTLSKEVFYSIKIISQSNKEMVLDIYPYFDEKGEYDDFNAIITKSGSENVYFVNYVFLDPMFECYSSFLKK
ncbi:MAG: hypothetical protein K9H49_07905 [Bacteroidales bacterium]|nr:hypothetical protein [Bacteroidales bacterium]MCF8390152.1 hypothetical protein [Bacteroidales bacterium]